MRGSGGDMLIDNCPGNMRSDMAGEGERVGRRDGFGVKYWHGCSVELRRKGGKARSALAETSAYSK